MVEGKASQLLVDVIRSSWDRLGFGAVDDEAFFQLVLARLVEPTSKLDSLRVIGELGLEPLHPLHHARVDVFPAVQYSSAFPRPRDNASET